MSTMYVGVDLGGTNLSAALADERGEVVDQAKRPTESHEGPVAVLDRMAAMVNDLAARNGSRPAGLGIGVPGLVDLAAGVTKFLPNLPTQWRDVPVRQILEPRVNCPVYLLNDARAATLGEHRYGHGKNTQTMIFFGLGTGVGGGVVVDGVLRLGPMGAAGELGHQTVLPGGPRCGCGNVGCLETLASGPAITAEGVRLMLGGQAPILRELAKGEASAVTTELMGKAAEAGEASVLGAIERAGRWLGIGAANMAVALHPELVVIGGGVSALGEMILGPVRRTLKECVFMFPPETVRVERSMLGDRAGVRGAVALAIEGGLVRRGGKK